MADVEEDFLSIRFNTLKNVISQVREIATKIKDVAEKDNVTIHYTVPMHKELTSEESLKEIVEEENILLLDSALTSKRKELYSLIEEMAEVLEQV